MNNSNYNDYYFNILAHTNKPAAVSEAASATSDILESADGDSILSATSSGMIGAIGEVNSDIYQELLSKSKGKYIICELLIGVNNMVLREGILTEVGPSYFVLYDTDRKAFTVCDLYSLKFITFFPPDRRPTTAEFNKWLDEVRKAQAQMYLRGSNNA